MKRNINNDSVRGSMSQVPHKATRLSRGIGWGKSKAAYEGVDLEDG